MTAKRPRNVALVWAGLMTAALAVNCLPASEPAAEDIVITRSSKTAQTAKRRGEIVEWLGSTITLQSGTRERRIDFSSVVDVQTNWPADFDAALLQMKQNDFSNAATSLQRAIDSENRPWARRAIRAKLVECASAMQKNRMAIQNFLDIVKEDPETRFFGLVPLKWSSSIGPNDVDADARSWIESPDSLLRLMGASWLLSGPARAPAKKILEGLSHEAEPRIAHLAAAQLWRTDAINATGKQIEAWQKLIEQMPTDLRPGPYYVLAQAQVRAGQTDEAAINLMRIPILYRQHFNLSAAALYQAGSALKDAGRTAEANNVWNELRRDFGTTQWAKDAAAKMTFESK